MLDSTIFAANYLLTCCCDLGLWPVSPGVLDGIVREGWTLIFLYSGRRHPAFTHSREIRDILTCGPFCGDLGPTTWGLYGGLVPSGIRGIVTICIRDSPSPASQKSTSIPGP